MKERSQLPEMYTPVEPDWLKQLGSIMGVDVVVETTRNSLYGRILEVEHDHIVFQVGHGAIFIRCQQIISVMPLPKCSPWG